MRAYNQNRGYKSTTKTFLPVLPLVRIKLDSEQKNKANFITFELKIRAGTGPGTPSYKKFVKTFEEGSPQEWMDVLTGLKEIWKQNSVNGPTDRAATVAAILKGDSLTAFDSAMEDARTNPDLEEDEDPVPLAMTLEHVETSLCAVTDIVFPFRAIETQKQWMSRHMRKPYDLTARHFGTALSRINNYLPYFPEGTAATKYSEQELVEIMEFALPSTWRKAMDIKGFVPKDNSKKALVAECERIERNKTPVTRDKDRWDDHNKNNKNSRFGKSANDNKKSGSKTSSGDGQFFCKECGHNPTHSTDRCFKLKKIAKEQEERRNGHVKKFQAPYSKRTFRKEVNAMARRAGKNDTLKIVEKAVMREHAKQAKQGGKKQATVAFAKKPETNQDSDTSSDESMHNLEAKIPRKKSFAKRNVRYNSRAEVVDIESSDSEDDRKMPAKISKKRTHKTEPMDYDSSEEMSVDDNKPTAEEKAFLKAIDKKEKKAKASSSDSE